MKKALILILSLLAGPVLLAQVTVRGEIKSSDNEPLVGVGIVEKGTMNGVVSGMDGSYSITVKGPGSVLVFSSIGFRTEEITVGNQRTVNVTLNEDQQLLDEVVVLGYSSKTKGEITSAVTVVNEEKLKDVVTSDLGQMLQGKVAGVSVVNSSGQPGSSTTIRVRGTSSMNAPQEPLYVVDGIIGGSYDPNDVETVTVLKDAGSTGMYGAQANGGVIVITTKHARNDKIQFNFKANVGVATADFSRQKLMDSKQLYQYYREYYRDPETGLVDDVAYQMAAPKSVMDTYTDWRGLIFRPALLQNYHLSMMGRSARTPSIRVSPTTMRRVR